MKSFPFTVTYCIEVPFPGWCEFLLSFYDNIENLLLNPELAPFSFNPWKTQAIIRHIKNMCEIWTLSMEAAMSSYQITGISNETWRAFRRMCLEEGISANRKLLQIIEAEVKLAEGGIEGTVNSTGPGKIESRGERK
jgi:hypothetical protein